MASWDDEDFDADEGFKGAPSGASGPSDKWDGEDEDVKGAWDDEEEEKKEEDPNRVKAVQKKKKKKLEDILKEKEEKKRQEIEARRKAEEERLQETSAEGVLEERLKRQQLQEESDLALAKEAFGVTDGGRVTIDSMYPRSEDDFKEFGKLLKEKLLKFQESNYYVDFLDDLFQACSLDLDAEHVRKLGTSLTAIAQEKTKAQKAATKGKKKTKKAVLAGSGKGGRGSEMDSYDVGTTDLLSDFI